MLSTKSVYIKFIAVLLMCCSVVVFGQSAIEKKRALMSKQEMKGKRPGKNQDEQGIIHPDFSIGLMSSSDVQGTVEVGQNRQEVKGRLNLDLMTSPELLERGVIEGRDVTLALFGVDYTKIAAKRANGKNTGAIGFSAAKSDGPISFKVDRESGIISATIAGTVDNAVLSDYAREPAKDPRGFDDYIPVPLQKATLDLQIMLDEPLSAKAPRRASKKKGVVSYNLNVRPSKQPQISGYTIAAKFPFIFDLYPYLLLEVGRDLCVQPVQILSSASDPDPTGDYLTVGMAGANTELNKADVTFTVRPFKQVINSAWKVASSGERAAIRASVEDDDCVEIFFVENHDPVSLSGGGASWGCGTATSQIVTSDGNNNGIDNTHLAHELGHTLDLDHPSGAYASSCTISSYGSLMCGSGWERDNPQRNSLQNKENLSNPLLKFTLKKLTANVDCTDNSDCGTCAEWMD
ncbi:MAG: hypothetical protein P8J18_06000 [Halieaceae bacterium]|nr:hypothetical protein [Halieaceae bacterium]